MKDNDLYGKIYVFPSRIVSKEVNMQHPKDVKGSDRPLPRNDGKFVLDGKRVEFSDYGGSSKVSIDDRLDRIESEIKVMNYVVGKNILALEEIEKRIAIMQEKIDGID